MNSDLPPNDDRVQAIRQRDRDMCQYCRRKQGEVPGLDIHQIVPGDSDVQPLSNFLLLCEDHHRMAHEKSAVVT
jgi:5-methylcytosine-specific restriction endonuclease McrA